MSTTYTYVFKDSNGYTDTINVTVSTTDQSVSGQSFDGRVTGNGYAVTSITGTFEGSAISGMDGNGAQVQSTASGGDTTSYDNTIFPSASSGADSRSSSSSGNINGIDVYGLEFTVGGTEYNLYTHNGTFTLGDVPSNSSLSLTLLSTTAPCFCAGTLIRTPDGERNVEELKAGDMVLTVDGQAVPVRWIGRREVDLRFADPLRALPVRIKQGALGNSLPARDLLVSPDHAMFMDGMLVQAGAMVNGMSIVREARVENNFTYYHIETPDHSLILAEAAATETFIDNTERMGFDNWAEYEALGGEKTPLVEMAYSRVKSTRQLPATLRAELNAIAARFAAEIPMAA